MAESITLSDGRKLGFAEYGQKHGTPVLFCHGTPGSRLTLSPEMSQTADTMGFHIIAPDRPGYGLSDPVRPLKSGDFSFIGWAVDALALLNKLEIKRCHVLGYSMGSPYALACAHALPERVSGITLVGGIAPNISAPEVIVTRAPGSNVLFALARDNQAQLLETLKSLAPDGDSLLATMAAGFPEADKTQFTQSEISSAFQRDCAEVLRQGHDAAASDFILAANPWGFNLETIQPAVHIWNGVEDLNVPPAMAKYLATALPHNTIHLLPGTGHLCLFTHWQNILLNIK